MFGWFVVARGVRVKATSEFWSARPDEVETQSSNALDRPNSGLASSASAVISKCPARSTFKVTPSLSLFLLYVIDDLVLFCKLF